MVTTRKFIVFRGMKLTDHILVNPDHIVAIRLGIPTPANTVVWLSNGDKIEVGSTISEINAKFKKAGLTTV